MSNGDDWISKRVEEAQRAHPSVTDAAATRMKQLLRGQLSERQLRSIELTSTAKTLISDMSTLPPPKKSGGKQ
jgi:hypothetical protein